MSAPLEPMPDAWKRALAVVAHPDDMEYGCADSPPAPGPRSVSRMPSRSAASS